LYKNFGKNIKTAVAGAGGTIYDTGKSIGMLATGETSVTEVPTSFLENRKAMTTSLARGGNAATMEGLNDLPEGKTPEEIAQLLAVGVKDGEQNILYAKKGETDANGNLVLGFNDSNAQGYINLANGNATETMQLIGTDAHERAHLATSNENIANSAANNAQTGWTISNWINGGSVSNGTVSQGQWNGIHSNNQMLTANTNTANSVPIVNRDNNTVMLGGVGTENETKKYMTALQEKFKKAGVVQPEYVPISQGGKVPNVVNTLLNVKGDIPYVASDDIFRYGPVSKIVSASNEEGGQRNIVGYSYGSVMGANAALEMANKGIYVDNVALVGSPVSSDSTLYNDLKTNNNIGNVIRVDILKDPFSNGIDLGYFVSSDGSQSNTITNNVITRMPDKINQGLDTHFYYINNDQNQQDNLSKSIADHFNNK
jgi:hypothetical protein